MSEGENKENSNQSKEEEKPHVCSVCSKPSDTVICHACEDKLRGEALEKKLDAEKHGH